MCLSISGILISKQKERGRKRTGVPAADEMVASSVPEEHILHNLRDRQSSPCIEYCQVQVHNVSKMIRRDYQDHHDVVVRRHSLGGREPSLELAVPITQ